MSVNGILSMKVHTQYSHYLLKLCKCNNNIEANIENTIDISGHTSFQEVNLNKKNHHLK